MTLGEGTLLVTALGVFLNGVGLTFKYGPQWRKRWSERPRLQTFELVPIRFECDFGLGQAPTVLVVLRAINYSRRSLEIQTTRVQNLHPTGTASFPDIVSLDHFTIAPCQSYEIYCRRKIDAYEVEQVLGLGTPNGSSQAHIMFEAVTSQGKRLIPRQTGSSHTIFGTFRGLAEHVKSR
jgi:hypothetical protein